MAAPQLSTYSPSLAVYDVDLSADTAAKAKAERVEYLPPRMRIYPDEHHRPQSAWARRHLKVRRRQLRGIQPPRNSSSTSPPPATCHLPPATYHLPQHRKTRPPLPSKEWRRMFHALYAGFSSQYDGKKMDYRELICCMKCVYSASPPRLPPTHSHLALFHRMLNQPLVPMREHIVEWAQVYATHNRRILGERGRMRSKDFVEVCVCVCLRRKRHLMCWLLGRMVQEDGQHRETR